MAIVFIVHISSTHSAENEVRKKEAFCKKKKKNPGRPHHRCIICHISLTLTIAVANGKQTCHLRFQVCILGHSA